MRELWTEIRRTLVLAVPIIFGQFGQMLMPLIDSAMVGRLGVVPLAAVAFGNMVVWVPMVAGFGLCVAVHVLVASARGSGSTGEASEVLRHGFFICAIYGLGCGAFLHMGLPLLHSLPRVDPRVIVTAEPYIVWMGWSVISVLLFVAAKNYCEALERPWLPLVILGVEIALNIVLNYFFIFGHGGFAAMGVKGAAVATAISRLVGLVILVVCILRDSNLRPEWETGVWSRLSGERIQRMLALGVPSGIQIFFEVGLFNFTTLLAGMIGTVTLAAHQIALNLASIAYMMPLGLSMATGIRVSHATGLGRFDLARRIGFGGIAFSSFLMAIYAAVIFATRQWLPLGFLGEGDPDAGPVLVLAATLLAWAASFGVFDGVQITALGALRGMHDVRLPTGMLFAGYWGVSAPLAWYLGLHAGHGGPGLWAGLLGGLGVVAVLLTLRFEFVSRKRLGAGVAATDNIA